MSETVERKVLTIAEAAQALGVSTKALYAAAKRGEFPTRKIGDRVLVPKAQFEAWLAGKSDGDATSEGAQE